MTAARRKPAAERKFYGTRPESERERAIWNAAVEDCAQTIEVGSLSYEGGEIGPCFANESRPGSAGIVADYVRDVCTVRVLPARRGEKRR